MPTIRIDHEITKDQLLEIIHETSFSKPEIEQIMHSLLPPPTSTYNWRNKKNRKNKRNRRNIQNGRYSIYM